jgi:hypothetical protein
VCHLKDFRFSSFYLVLFFSVLTWVLIRRGGRTGHTHSPECTANSQHISFERRAGKLYRELPSGSRLVLKLKAKMCFENTPTVYEMVA